MPLLPDPQVRLIRSYSFERIISDYLSRLKCDRQVPCTTCTNSGSGPSCSYAVRPANGRERRDEGLRTSEAHLRLQKLEEMVTSLMQRTEDGSGEPNTNNSASNGTIEQKIGCLSVDGSLHSVNNLSKGHLNYQGGTHWSAILENVGCSSPNSLCVTQQLPDS